MAKRLSSADAAMGRYKKLQERKAKNPGKAIVTGPRMKAAKKNPYEDANWPRRY